MEIVKPEQAPPKRTRSLRNALRSRRRTTRRCYRRRPPRRPRQNQLPRRHPNQPRQRPNRPPRRRRRRNRLRRRLSPRRPRCSSGSPPAPRPRRPRRRPPLQQPRNPRPPKAGPTCTDHDLPRSTHARPPVPSSSAWRCALHPGRHPLLVVAPGASAGTYTVQVCGDAPQYQSQAFSQFANRGMRWKRACNPEGGPSLRGMVSSNVIRPGRVKRGAQSRFVFSAPNGTTFDTIEVEWLVARRDCRYALQVYALRPGASPVVIRNRPANRKCPRGVRAQASQVRGTRTVRKSIAGATQIVQRAVCVGAKGKRFCSARSFNGHHHLSGPGHSERSQPSGRRHRGRQPLHPEAPG